MAGESRLVAYKPRQPPGGNVTFRNFRLKPWLTLAATFGLLVGTATSQETAGTITGAVTDAQDAMVPDATLTLSNLEQGVSREATSNHHGIYQFNFLEPGRYQVT